MKCPICHGTGSVDDWGKTIDAAIADARRKAIEETLTAIAQDIGTEYARASNGGWRATCEALERIDIKIRALIAEEKARATKRRGER